MKFLILSAVTFFCSFFTPNPVKSVSKTHSMEIYVKTKSGNPVNYAKVGYSVCESFSCLGGKSDLRTDKNGYVRLEWEVDCSICKIFINGKSNEDDYKEGGSYTFIAE